MPITPKQVVYQEMLRWTLPHLRNWIDCMGSRQRPLCDVVDDHHVAVACNLANMSVKLGRSIRWDPDKQVVIGDKEAAAQCYRPYREPWDKVLRSIVTV